jgi:inorganic pyrophosphatase
MNLLLAPALALLLAPQGGPTGWVHPFDYPQPETAPEEVLAVIEIPAGGTVKYELDKATGHPVVSRFPTMAVAYPANYGCFSQTLSGDGDPLDVFLYTRSPLVPGCLVLVRPVGILRSIDGGEEDDKILAVPVPAVDPTFAGINDLDDLPAADRDRLAEFLLSYKRLPVGSKKVEILGFDNAAAARFAIEAARKRYNESPRARPAQAPATPAAG